MKLAVLRRVLPVLVQRLAQPAVRVLLDCDCLIVAEIQRVIEVLGVLDVVHHVADDLGRLGQGPSAARLRAAALQHVAVRVRHVVLIARDLHVVRRAKGILIHRQRHRLQHGSCGYLRYRALLPRPLERSGVRVIRPIVAGLDGHGVGGRIALPHGHQGHIPVHLDISAEVVDRTVLHVLDLPADQRIADGVLNAGLACLFVAFLVGRVVVAVVVADKILQVRQIPRSDAHFRVVRGDGSPLDDRVEVALLVICIIRRLDHAGDLRIVAL